MTDPPMPWASVDPWKFSEGGYSREEFERYREVCSLLWRAGALTGGISWTLDDGTFMFISYVGGMVTWRGMRPEPPGEAAARAQAASTGLGYPTMSRDFTMVVGWAV